MANNTVLNVTSSTPISYSITIEWYLVAIIASLLLAAYILVFAVILANPSEFKNSYYTLIQALALADFYSLYFVIYRAVFGKTYYGSTIDKVFIFLYQSFAWHNGLHLNVAIGFNRFCAIAFFVQYQKYFTVLMARILALICLISAMAISTYQFFVPAGLNTITDLIIGNTLISIVIFTCIVSTSICFITVHKCNDMTKVSYVREMKMLFQGTIVSALLFVVEIMYWFPITELLLKIAVMLATGMNPIIYIVLDKKLRDCCIQLLFDKVVTIVTSKSHTTTNEVVHLSTTGQK